jgi:predicted SPOUT superfamily RNA methylase MTH1
VIQFSRVTVGCDNPDSDTRQESAFRHGHTREGITIEIDGSRVLVDPGVDRDLLELVTQTLKRSV